MVDNDYTLEGRFEIANENMKQEMNELIIQILYKTGIRKTTTVMINGREFDAVEQTYPDVSYRITCNNGNQRTLINP